MTHITPEENVVDPERHWASSKARASLPPMGMRVRLLAMMRYGMLLTDNGSAWFVSGAPDARRHDTHLPELSRVPSSAFDVVRMGTIHQ